MKLVIAAFLSAIVCFLWGFLSWQVMTWHTNGWSAFQDESAVTKVIKANATSGRGLYVLPFPRKPSSLATAAEKESQQEGYDKAMADGPYLFATIRPGTGEVGMVSSMILSFLRSFIASLIIGVMLNTATLNYIARIAFVGAAGLFTGLVADVPGWIWMEFPGRDMAVNLLDHFIEWTLAGAVLGLFLGRDPTAQDVRH